MIISSIGSPLHKFAKHLQNILLKGLQEDNFFVKNGQEFKKSVENLDSKWSRSDVSGCQITLYKYSDQLSDTKCEIAMEYHKTTLCYSLERNGESSQTDHKFNLFPIRRKILSANQRYTNGLPTFTDFRRICYAGFGKSLLGKINHQTS